MKTVLPTKGWAGSTYATNFQLFSDRRAAGQEIEGSIYVCAFDAYGNGDPNVSDQQAVLWEGETRIADIVDGTSNTLMLAEKFGRCGDDSGGNMWARWDRFDTYQPTFAAIVQGPESMFQDNPLPWDGNNSPCVPQLAQTPHSGAMTVALADGSVRSLNASMNADIWWALCTPDGGEVIGEY